MSTISTSGSSSSLIRYVLPSETGLEGPDQVLKADVDSVWKADGRVRIKIGQCENDDFEIMSIPGLVMKMAKKYPDHPALISRPQVDGKRTALTYSEYETKVRTVAKAFLKLGLERHHSVCIIGFNAPQWLISYLAAIYAGGIAVGIYTTNSPEACQYCAEHSQANIIIVDDAKQLDKIMQIRNNLPKLKTVIQFEGIPSTKDVLDWDQLLEIGEMESNEKLNAVLKTIGVNECCTIVYTSGTVGNPKAVMLSHDNQVAEARTNIKAFDLNHEAREIIVSYLPLSHVYAQLLDIYMCTMLAGTLYFANKDALRGSLIDTLTAVRPTFFISVPRIWEKIHEKMQEAVRNNGMIKQWISQWAKTQGLLHNSNHGSSHDVTASWTYLIAKNLIFKRVKTALGFDRCQNFISGGAPLSNDIKNYFMSLDIVIYDGYGTSENSGAHLSCTKSNFRQYSVGRSPSGFRTKLVNIDTTGEGEICMSGRHIFMGYLGDSEKTRETKDEDGWLHSGDLGRIDADGFVFITGRIKELVITTGGENIPSVRIEQILINECPGLSNAMIIGDKKKYLTILVTIKTEINSETGEPLDSLSPEALKWASSLGSKARSLSEILETHDILIYQAIQEAINCTNKKAINNAQHIQKFKILPHEFSISTGELGPTTKLRRNFVLKKYASLIEEMYEE